MQGVRSVSSSAPVEDEHILGIQEPLVDEPESKLQKTRKWIKAKLKRPLRYLSNIVRLYLLIVVFIYIMDYPKYGGTSNQCRKNHIDPPEISKNNATYPYPNTFNQGRKFSEASFHSKYAYQNIQQFGTHNSYHKLNSFGNGLFWLSWFCYLIPGWRRNFAYEYPVLTSQLNSGYRNFELDIHIRPGGIMNYHKQMWDQDTVCYCFSECLKEMKRWSNDNSGHGPIVVIVEPKTFAVDSDSYLILNDISLTDLLGAEQEILNIIASDHLITPDQIRINSTTSLQDSVETRGWPNVYDMRDTFLFILWYGEQESKYFGLGNSDLRVTSG